MVMIRGGRNTVASCGGLASCAPASGTCSAATDTVIARDELSFPDCSFPSQLLAGVPQIDAEIGDLWGIVDDKVYVPEYPAKVHSELLLLGNP